MTDQEHPDHVLLPLSPIPPAQARAGPRDEHQHAIHRLLTLSENEIGRHLNSRGVLRQTGYVSWPVVKFMTQNWSHPCALQPRV